MRNLGFRIFLMMLILLFSVNFKMSTGNKELLINNQRDHAKVIYLTFDDGPITPVTDKILDILKEKRVKATFFVIGKKVKIKEQLIKRIYDEGNGIGLHSYTHDYSKIYCSHKAFIEEMDKSSDEIYDVIGIHPKIIRFPTGSKGHLTKTFYKKSVGIYWGAPHL